MSEFGDNPLWHFIGAPFIFDFFLTQDLYNYWEVMGSGHEKSLTKFFWPSEQQRLKEKIEFSPNK